MKQGYTVHGKSPLFSSLKFVLGLLTAAFGRKTLKQLQQKLHVFEPWVAAR